MAFKRDLNDLFMGGLSSIVATIFTNPIEVVKTRLQLQGEMKASAASVYRGVIHGMYVIGRNEGMMALQRGLSAMIWYQFFLNTFRLGVFRMCERRNFTKDSEGQIILWKSAAAAAVGGSIGSVPGTPFYLVKARLQAMGANEQAVGHQHKHSGMMDAFRHIYAEEGYRGLCRGMTPLIMRGAVGSGTQIASFAYAKEWLVQQNITDSPMVLSFLGANLGGIVMTACLHPFDMAATRMSNQPVDSQHRGTLYSSMTDVFVKTVRAEGPLGLYKGVVANYLRLGSHTVLLLVCWDQLKILEDYLRR